MQRRKLIWYGPKVSSSTLFCGITIAHFVDLVLEEAVRGSEAEGLWVKMNDDEEYWGKDTDQETKNQTPKTKLTVGTTFGNKTKFQQHKA